MVPKECPQLHCRAPKRTFSFRTRSRHFVARFERPLKAHRRPISGWLAAHWHASLARFGPQSHFIWQNWRAGAVLLVNSTAWLGEPKTTLNKINRASRIIFGNQQSELYLGKKSANVRCNVEGLQPVGLCELLGRVDAAFGDASNR